MPTTSPTALTLYFVAHEGDNAYDLLVWAENPAAAVKHWRDHFYIELEAQIWSVPTANPKSGVLPWDTSHGVRMLDLDAPRFNHAYALAFSVETEDETGEHVPPDVIRQGILQRISDLSDEDLKEAVGVPHDSYKLEPEGGQ